MGNLKSIDKIYSGLKASAKKRGVNFSINKTDLYDIDIPLLCPVLGIPLRFERGNASDNSVSYDRIDNSKGYEVDNIMIISYRANRLKSDATLYEMKLLAEFYNSISPNTEII